MSTDPVIHGERVELRPLSEADLPWLREALHEPSVAEWWDQGVGWTWVDELIPDPEVHPYVVELAGERIGYVQWDEEADPGYRHGHTDLFISGAWQGQGFGTEVVRTVARWLVDVRGLHRLVIDPCADNTRAIRCYERVGYRPIGIARRRERAADGTWRDSLLMDLLADELT